MPNAALPPVEIANKRFIMDAVARIAEATPDALRPALDAAYHPDAEWRGSHPLNEMRGVEAIEATVWRPLLHAFPDLERRDTIVAAGRYLDADFVATVGHYCGTFREDWLTIPATGRPVFIRSGEVHRIEDGRIRQSTVLLDVLDVIRQAGFWPIAPSLGTEGRWPGRSAPAGSRSTRPTPRPARRTSPRRSRCIGRSATTTIGSGPVARAFSTCRRRRTGTRA